ncbi:MAG: DUF1439 domain-containing protein [Gammaproteobacteria bacterium]|nr:DUF1439 domain-containing protein [Gammaproteobacteria bacterium]MDH5802469.1 DUF1439 domain-containing protein [Gammaproteobacteria bacterium]
MKTLIRFFLMSSLLHGFTATAMTFTFSEAQLQNHLAAQMPIQRQEMMLTLVVSRPQLKLLAETNRIQVDSELQAQMLGLSATGTVRVNGSVSYNPTQGTFYFNNPKVVEIQIDQLPHNLQSTVKKLTEQIIITNLREQALFKLDKKNTRHKLLQSTLKSIQIKDRQLVIVFDTDTAGKKEFVKK